MATEPRELRPSELVDVADTLAKAASEASIEPSGILLRLDVPVAQMDLSGAPAAIWLRIVHAIHAGASAKAGYRADAVARLIETLAAAAPGNTALSGLAYTIGQGSQARLGSPSIFLGYARADRSDVDQLYAALHKAQAGLALFQDHRMLRPGQVWLDILRERVGSASLLVCWVTSDYLRSAFCNYEIGVAESAGATIVPIFVEAGISGRVPAYLSWRQAITMGDPPHFDDLATQLIALIN